MMKLLQMLFTSNEESVTEAAPRVIPGRNDTCWCGSGKKYKHCHEPLDNQLKQAERDKQRACSTYT